MGSAERGWMKGPKRNKSRKEDDSKGDGEVKTEGKRNKGDELRVSGFPSADTGIRHLDPNTEHLGGAGTVLCLFKPSNLQQKMMVQRIIKSNKRYRQKSKEHNIQQYIQDMTE